MIPQVYNLSDLVFYKLQLVISYPKIGRGMLLKAEDNSFIEGFSQGDEE